MAAGIRAQSRFFGSVGAVTTFITRYETSGPGVRLAVKDLIDMEGEPTTAGCRAVAEQAKPAERDAACLAGARAAGARIVGRANLHELAFGVTGINPWFGTPVNPLGPNLVPGGSSSGCAVAVGTGEADVAFGSDTGGSVRIPSACCGTAGLKTTFGRIPLEGVWPLSPSFDTIGPMARDTAGLVVGMQLLEPGFQVAGAAGDLRVGRVRLEADPAIDEAIDRVLAATGWQVSDLELPEWDQATATAGIQLVIEAWASNRELAERRPDGIGTDVLERLHLGRNLGDAASIGAASAAAGWRACLEGHFRGFDLIATPTLTIFPPEVGLGDDLLVARCTVPVNLAGVPALALPVPTSGALPASLQLIGPAHSEEQLLAAGMAVEAAIGAP
jgi:amidase